MKKIKYLVIICCTVLTLFLLTSCSESNKSEAFSSKNYSDSSNLFKTENKEEKDCFKITYDVNGGNSLEENTLYVRRGMPFRLNNDVRKEDNVFLGWTYKGELYNSTIYEKNTDITLVAKWGYTVEYRNSEEDVLFTDLLDTSQGLEEKNNINNYYVSSWYSNSECTTKFDFNSSNRSNTIIYVIPEYTFKYYEEESSITITGVHEEVTKDIVIPSYINKKPVTKIGLSAFDDNINIQSVFIPKTCTYIGNMAFSGCTNLAEIKISDSVSFIGDRAFSYCTSLKTITLPKSTAYLSEYLFLGCTNLETVNLTESLLSISKGSFSGCIKLKNVKLPKALKSIGSRAFSSCSSLENIDIPDTLRSLGNLAFSDCTNLKSLIIPLNVENVGSYIFDGCSNLTIYCVSLEKPLNWDENWDKDSLSVSSSTVITVVWNYNE